MIDYARDKNKAEYYKLSCMNDVPGFVKEAYLMEESQLGSLQGTQFADSVMRMFPINSKHETWLSAAYIQKQAAEGEVARPQVMTSIKEACELWDIRFDSINTSMVEKQASNYLTIQYKDDTTVHATVSVQTGEQLEKVAADVLTPGNHTYSIRKHVSRQLLGASSALKHAFSPNTLVSLEKTAGYGLGSLPAVIQAISQRRCAIDKSCPHHVESMRMLEKAATDEADSDGILAGDILEKIAAVLDAVDRQENLSIKYGDSFTTPELQLYKVSSTQVENYQASMVKLANGRTYMKDSFNYKKVGEFLADVFEKESSDIPASMESLTYKEASTLSEYIDKYAKDYQEIGLDVDQLDPPENSPIEKDIIEDEEVAKPVEGQDTLSDSSTPREENNKDSTPRSA